jgi:hypothetical protein
VGKRRGSYPGLGYEGFPSQIDSDPFSLEDHYEFWKLDITIRDKVSRTLQRIIQDRRMRYRMPHNRSTWTTSRILIKDR